MDKKAEGKVLKGMACRRFSYSDEQRDMLHHFCEKPELSKKCERNADGVYKRFPKRAINISINPKSAIYACIYVTAALSGEYRTFQEFKRVFGVTPPTMAKWQHLVEEYGLVLEGLESLVKHYE